MNKTNFPRLTRFYWRGLNLKDQNVSGTLLVLNEQEVRAKLNAQQIRIKKIKKRQISSVERIKHTIKDKDITLLTRQLATILNAGIPLVQSLQLIAESNPKAEMKSILNQIILSVESGELLSKAMLRSSPFFNPFYLDMLATGEETGYLPQTFERLASYREKSEQLRSKVIKAMIYPTMVLLVSIIVAILMLTLVIPEFENIFSGFGAELPWFTQQIIQASYLLQHYGLWILILMLIGSFIFKSVYRRSYTLQLILSKNSLRIPIIGSILSKAAIAKFSRTLATSFNSGLPILHSLQITSKTTGNLYYQQAIFLVQQSTAAGMPLYLAMRHSQAFPEMVLQMVMIGEESGRLDDMLNKIALIYEEDIDNTVDNLGKLLEPLIIIFLGGMIGGLVVAMYLPIFNLMSVIG
ncbi:type II secretion system F family protein [Aliivibrio sp. S3MY1]|uniref:type II secretion system F family protein n=1 Tax=unclassified Aliivibrio TaxID=2645654 RepID=UPI003FCCBC0A